MLASLTKGGLNAATRSLAIEYARRAIRANAVALGVIKTPMHPVEKHAQLGALHPWVAWARFPRSSMRSCTSSRGAS